MSNHRQCCCAGGCVSDYRVFVPCSTTVQGYEFRNVAMTLAQLKYAGFDIAGNQLYLYTPPLPFAGECEPYCGTWQCITDPDPSDSDNTCTNESSDLCGDCPVIEDGYVQAKYRIVRPAELDDFVSAFQRIDYADDELQTGDCCDIRCPNRSPSACENGDVTACGGDDVRGCECIGADDVGVSFYMEWLPDKTGAVPSEREVRIKDPDCANAYVETQSFDWDLRYEPVGMLTNVINATNCPAPNGTTIEKRTYEVLILWRIQFSSFPTDPSWCVQGVVGQGPNDFWECVDSLGTYTDSWSVDHFFYTQNFIEIDVENFGGHVRIGKGFSVNTTGKTNVSAFNSAATDSCYASSYNNVIRLAAGSANGIAQSGGAPDWMGTVQFGNDPDRGTDMELCQNMNGVLTFEKTLGGSARLPYNFDIFAAPIQPYNWGTLKLHIGMLVPPVPPSPDPC